MAVNDFEVAKNIADLLAGMERDRQERVLRWVTESLGIAPGSVAQSPLVQPPAREVHSPPPGAPPGGPNDIKSFMESKIPKNDIQFATAAAYFYRFEAAPSARLETINAETLQDAARLAGRARFTSPVKTLNNAKQQGYLDSAERGAFRINSVGENLVAMTLPSGERAPATRRRPAQKKKTGTRNAKSTKKKAARKPHAPAKKSASKKKR